VSTTATDGIAAAQQRIAALAARVQSLAPPAPMPAPISPLAVTTEASSFASYLGRAQAAGTSRGTLAPPPELAAYGNGRIPPSALAAIGVGQHRLYAPAAQAFTALRAGAAADGVTIGVTDSYRSYDEQVALAARKGLYRDGGLAATPGTSNHGWGLALDLDLDSKAQAWMRQHAPSFGFVEDVPREPWHWEWKGAHANA
jgi:D-alanyl-D-alanine carboxypeptidase